jgi:hypothetical protein
VRLSACAILCCAERRPGCALESIWLGLAREAVADARERLSYEMRRPWLHVIGAPKQIS